MRQRKKDVNTTFIANSTIIKISSQAAKRNVRNITIPAKAASGRKANEILNRKIIQASTGRTLDHMKIFDKKVRSRVQRACQKFAGGFPKEEMLLARIEIAEALGERGEEFIEKFTTTQNANQLRTTTHFSTITKKLINDNVMRN